MVEKKVAIVTGGSSGIGQATCIALAKVGFNLGVVGTNPDRIADTLEKLDNSTGPPLGLPLDVTNPRDMVEMVDRTMERFGRIDLLVASAGLGKKVGSQRVMPYATADLPLEEWNQILNVNLTGVFLSNQAVLPVMQGQQGGHIINISSSTTPRGLRGTPYAPAYCASKFGVIGLTEHLASEVSSDGIRVQALLPGHGNTSLTSGTMLFRLHGGTMSPAHVAHMIVYLVQSKSDTVIVHPHLIPFVKSKKLI